MIARRAVPLAVMSVVSCLNLTALAQTYPSRPITMIVPFPPGGPTDAVGRIVAEQMKTSLGQSVVVENISGADGTIGVGRAVRARPDGYTVHIGIIASHVLNGAMYSLPYDVLHDVAPVSPLVRYPDFLFAAKTIPANDLGGLIAWLKNNPNKLAAGIDTAGTRVLTTLFQKEMHAQFTLVPYRGAAPTVQDLVAGRIDLFFNPPFHLPFVRDGSIKAYAVTSDMRSPLAPELPTFREVGLPAISYTGWYALFAPKNTPTSIVKQLNAAVVTALAEPTVRSRIADLNLEIFPREQQTPQTLAALQKADAEKWWPVMQELGVRAE
jgi:tripartite-type tricarboxylate transporter receptor subunit TctC